MQQFQKFMEANDVKNGGSFYLQSKFYRANELLQDYILEKQQKSGTAGGVPPASAAEEAEQQQQEQSTSSDQQQQQSK